MKKGKVSENIISRSVIKTIKYKNRSYIMTGAALGSDASVNAVGTVMGTAGAGLMFENEKLWYGSELLNFDVKRAFFNAVNNVAAQCGEPKAVSVNLVLPRKTKEQDIKSLMRMISGICEREKIEIAGGDTEITDNVKSPIINFTAFGEYIPEEFTDIKSVAEEGMDIVISGYIATSGTAALVHLKRDALLERFQGSYLEKALALENCMNNVPASVRACHYGVRIMHDLSRGGIYSGLWELAEKTGKGVEAVMDCIPVRQETIEVCERYNLNPYKLLSNGAMLMAVRNGGELCEYLNQREIHAVVIGRLTNNNDKVILKNDEKRYIEPPRGDQLYVLMN